MPREKALLIIYFYTLLNIHFQYLEKSLNFELNGGVNFGTDLDGGNIMRFPLFISFPLYLFWEVLSTLLKLLVVVLLLLVVVPLFPDTVLIRSDLETYLVETYFET